MTCYGSTDAGAWLPLRSTGAWLRQYDIARATGTDGARHAFGEPGTDTQVSLR